MKKIYCFLLLLFPLFLLGNITSKTIYINAGYYHTFNNDSFPAIAFNDSTVFNQQNALINLESNDTLVLKIINNDTTEHGFDIKHAEYFMQINPADSIIDTLSLSDGIYIYYDSRNSFAILGGAGIITKGMQGEHNNYWNIKEFEKGINETYATTGIINLGYYTPNHFTINGKSKKELLNDTLAFVSGNVGDTIHIFISNTGLSVHSLHFHGYHCEILASSKNQQHIGRSKDTFPIYPYESLILELIPDKPGLYPIHDHNLIAVTGDNVYPNGIFVMINIAP
jgi:FtsP/CotA-like multicopper oxidase with cupredoxin domain